MIRHVLTRVVLLVLVVPATFAGCGSDGDATVDAGDARPLDGAEAGGAMCVWGSVQACVCPTGAPGARRCLSDGTFGPCVCGALADTGTADVADAGSAGGTDGAPPADADLAADVPRDVMADRPPDTAPDITPDVPAAALTTRTLTLQVRHLLADRTRKLLYATVAGTAPMHANSLVVIDPATLAVKHAVALGSDPGSMAMSDSGAVLWVAIDGAFSVRKVDLTTSPPTAAAPTVLPKGDYGDTASAGPMAVLPGSNTSLAVSLHRAGVSPSFSGAVVLDDGVARAMKTGGHTGASRLVAGQTGWLFGFNNLHTGFGFYALAVSSTGLTQTEHQGLVNGFDTDIVYAANRVYATSGEVVDVSNPATPRRAGKFGFAGLVLPRPTANRVFMLGGGDSFDRTEARLRVLDPVTFTQLTSAPVTGLMQERVFDLVDLGGDTLAFLSGGDRFSTMGTIRIHVLTSALVGSTP